MRRRVLAIGSAIVATLAIGASLVQMAAQQGQTQPMTSQPGMGARTPKNAAEFDEMFNKISNSGRWGKDDQLGAANLMTDAKRKQAGALVKSGISVSLAHNLLTEVADDNASPF